MANRPQWRYGYHPPACTCVRCVEHRRQMPPAPPSNEPQGSSRRHSSLPGAARQSRPSVPPKGKGSIGGLVAFVLFVLILAGGWFFLARPSDWKTVETGGTSTDLPPVAIAGATRQPTQGERPTEPLPTDARPPRSLSRPDSVPLRIPEQKSPAVDEGRGTLVPEADWVERDRSASGQIWTDRWVKFTEDPRVCDSVLSFAGSTQNGAAVGDATSGINEFTIYRRADLAPRVGYSGYLNSTVPPVLSFLVRAPPGSFYASLPPGLRVARVLQASPNRPEFRLVSDVPAYIADDPGDFALGIWGFRPSAGSDAIRLIALKECE